MKCGLSRFILSSALLSMAVSRGAEEAATQARPDEIALLVRGDDMGAAQTTRLAPPHTIGVALD
jgi:hypothetical protein